MRGTASKETVKKKKKKPNKELMLITSIFSLLFFMMGGYLAYYLAFQSESTINNSYNHRQETFEEVVVRGSIFAADGSVLAETVAAEDGTEIRTYPYGNVFAHVVGYNTHGKSGIESLMNFNLLRSNIATIDYLSNEVKGIKNPGDSVWTTLDTELQQVCYDALGSHDGAVVVMDASSGQVISMVSKPDYDPNVIDTIWDEINENGSSVLLNRATDGLYPPGSVFKILTTLEYIKENKDYEAYDYTCTSIIKGEDFYIQCHNLEVHGEVDLKKSFAESCNTSYVNLGLTLDMTAFRKTAETMLFNQALPASFPAAESSFDLTAEDSVFTQAQTVIGQGTTLVTPVHMAMIASGIANDGELMKPYLVTKIVSADGKTVQEYQPELAGNLMTRDEAAVLQEFMRETAVSGTASSLNSDSYTVYGKTGTAQFGSETNNHFWFAGFVEKDGKRYAMSVVVEDEQASSNQAVSVMKDILQTYFQN